MQYLHLAKRADAEPLVANVVGDVPKFTREQDKAAWHDAQAKILLDALLITLPGETLDRLAIRLMGAYAIRHGKA